VRAAGPASGTEGPYSVEARRGRGRSLVASPESGHDYAKSRHAENRDGREYIGAGPGVTAPNAVDLKQEIHFCTAPDGVQLAYSLIGQGPPLMKTRNWMTHLEFDLESPIWRHLYRELAKDHTLVRYDPRGNGLSDRTVDEICSTPSWAIWKQ
jgi:hypothetical protein